MPKTDQDVLIQKFIDENPQVAEIVKMASEGMREFRESLVADGITGTINGVPFGPKRRDQ